MVWNKKENEENQKRICVLNQGMHNLLRGFDVPQTIMEEDNEYIQSVVSPLEYSREMQFL